MTNTVKPDISVIFPVFNEEDNLEPLLDELAGVLKEVGRPYEVICVDDKSTDNSLSVMKELQKKHPTLRIIRHTVNSGESAGQATGFKYANGDLVITMDADMQNDPADIPMMLGELTGDCVAVCGVRRVRDDDWIRRLSSRIANKFRNTLTGDRIADAGCTYRVLKRSALDDVLVFNGMHRFLPTILRLQGYQVKEVLVNHRARTRGKSKYGVGNRVWRGIADCFAMRWYRRRAVTGDRACEEGGVTA